MAYKDPKQKIARKKIYLAEMRINDPERWRQRQIKRNIEKARARERIKNDPIRNQEDKAKKKIRNKKCRTIRAQDPEKHLLHKLSKRGYKKTRETERNRVKNLSDTYVRKQLRLTKADASPDLVELKRQIMLLKRACNPNNPYHDTIQTTAC